MELLSSLLRRLLKADCDYVIAPLQLNVLDRGEGETSPGPLGKERSLLQQQGDNWSTTFLRDEKNLRDYAYAAALIETNESFSIG